MEKQAIKSIDIVTQEDLWELAGFFAEET